MNYVDLNLKRKKKTKKKLRAKQDHMALKHFKDKLDKDLPHCRPFVCPLSGDTLCDKISLIRHYLYTGKHVRVLKVYLDEALAE